MFLEEIIYNLNKWSALKFDWSNAKIWHSHEPRFSSNWSKTWNEMSWKGFTVKGQFVQQSVALAEASFLKAIWSSSSNRLWVDLVETTTQWVSVHDTIRFVPPKRSFQDEEEEVSEQRWHDGKEKSEGGSDHWNLKCYKRISWRQRHLCWLVSQQPHVRDASKETDFKTSCWCRCCLLLLWTNGPFIQLFVASLLPVVAAVTFVPIDVLWREETSTAGW